MSPESPNYLAGLTTKNNLISDSSMDEASTKSFYNIYHMWRCTAILKQYVRVTLIQKEKLYKHFGDLNLELNFFPNRTNTKIYNSSVRNLLRKIWVSFIS